MSRTDETRFFKSTPVGRTVENCPEKEVLVDSLLNPEEPKGDVYVSTDGTRFVKRRKDGRHL